MSTAATSPPPTPAANEFDANAWRQRLAGLTDPDYSAGDDDPAQAEQKEAAIELCLCLCDLFGASLDRMTLWDRIGSALASSAAKVDNGDIDRFVTMCLEHVLADVGAAGRHTGVAALLHAASEKNLSWRQGFVRYVAGHVYTIPVHARIRWEKIKVQRKDDRAYREGGKLSTGEIVEKGGEDDE